MSVNRRMNKQIVICSYYSAIKRKEQLKHTYDIDKSHRHYFDQKKLDTTEYILKNSISMNFNNGQNYNNL